MGLVFNAALILLGSWLINLFYNQLDFSLRVNRVQRLYGAKLPPVYAHKLPWGLDYFFQISKSQKEGKRTKKFQEFHVNYGKTFLHNHLMGWTIRTIDPCVIQAVATTHFEKFGVAPTRDGVGQPFIGRGVFTNDGKIWKRSRGLIRPSFTRGEVGANLVDFKAYVSRFLDLIPKDGSTIDLQPLIKRLYMDVSTEFLFGESTRSLYNDPPPRITEFMEAFDESLKGLGIRIIIGKYLRPLHTLFGIRWQRAYKKVHGFVDKRIQVSLDKLNSKEASSNAQQAYEKDQRGEHRILLDDLVKQTQDTFFLRHQIINIFHPARGTAALAFSNILFFLCRHPRYWIKLREEEVLLIPVSQPLTFEYLKTLKWVKAIINETLRIRLPANRGIRTALEDVVIPLGNNNDTSLFIPKGFNVEFDIQNLHWDPDHWGADVNEFRPERWLDPDRPLWEAKWQYLPYFGGERMCPAQQQTLTQMAYLLVRMAQTFTRVECRDDVQAYIEKQIISTESRNGVKMALWNF